MQIYKKPNKKVLLALIGIFLVIGVAGGTYYFTREKQINRPSLSQDYVIVEPEAPLLASASFRDSSYKPAESFQASDVSMSPDKSSSFLLESKDEKSSLKILNKDGKEIETVQSGNVIFAGYADPSAIVYQSVGTQDAGIYTYNVEKKQKQRVITTNDSQVFKNIAFIDKENYFFIQPKTGKIGFGKVGTNEIKVIDEKLLPVKTNYTRVNAYKFAKVSPDKKYVATYDLTAGNDKAVVRIFPTNANSLKDVYFEGSISLINTAYMTDGNPFYWAPDSSFLLTGDKASVISIKDKKVVSSLDFMVGQIALSPDGQKFSYCKVESNDCFVQYIAGNKEQVAIAKDIRQFAWINQNNLVLTIGEQIYAYNTTEKKLYSLTTERKKFELLSTDTSTSTVWVKADDKVLQFTYKNQEPTGTK